MNNTALAADKSMVEVIRQMMADWNAATPAQRMSASIKAMVAAGADPIDALKTVCGADAVDAMIASLYVELRAKGGR